jgi:hypothetical protein
MSNYRNSRLTPVIFFLEKKAKEYEMVEYKLVNIMREFVGKR